MTFPDLLRALTPFPADAPLLFETADARISGGYHVTELRIADATGIDCGGQVSTFQEARLQLLDGFGGAHMPVGKFRGIVEKSLARLPALAGPEVLVEFGARNDRLELLQPAAPIDRGGQIVVPLSAAAAVCKPVARRQTAGPCCSAAQA